MAKYWTEYSGKENPYKDTCVPATPETDLPALGGSTAGFLKKDGIDFIKKIKTAGYL